jgi:hypothetical protein
MCPCWISNRNTSWFLELRTPQTVQSPATAMEFKCFILRILTFAIDCAWVRTKMVAHNEMWHVCNYFNMPSSYWNKTT